MNRKGISPLIATVLLFAFAVAVSTMVITYVFEMTKSTPCDQVAIGIDAPQACYTDGKLQFIAINNGQQQITGIKVRIVSASNDVQEVKLANSLAPGSASSVSIPYQTISPSGTTATLVPIISHEGEHFCTAKETKITVGGC
jgi:flagellin-like protein